MNPKTLRKNPEAENRGLLNNSLITVALCYPYCNEKERLLSKSLIFIFNPVFT